MTEKIDFEEVLGLFESHGWKLQKIWEPYRVLIKKGELPWLVPVKDGKVDIEYVDKFKKFLESQRDR